MPRLRMIQGGLSDAPKPWNGPLFLRGQTPKRQAELLRAFFALYRARRCEELAAEAIGPPRPAHLDDGRASTGCRLDPPQAPR